MSLSPREYIRHILDEIDYTIVWDVATTKLSDLRDKLHAILNAMADCRSENSRDAES